ncbi:hypothetical protein [Nocardioides aquiterrae]|uniref:Uncharacterized protein n=1 Tax=Nocardioides aquiterrae TaxID=203799 RepID=A0ABP4FC89_9ACTN
MPVPGSDPALAVAAGLARAAAAACDRRLVSDGERLYDRVRQRVDPLVSAAGEVVVAFPSMLLHPGARHECLVVVLPEAVVVALRRKGARTLPEVIVVEKSTVSRVEIAPPPLSVPFPLAASLMGGFGVCVVGLPRGALVFGGVTRRPGGPTAAGGRSRR